MFLRQSTASQARVTPRFVDDTDFKTPETALTINNTDVKLSKNGAAEASKNSGGGTHLGSGRYSLTFDATDTNTVGELAVGIVISGALPVEMKFFVVEEAVYDANFAASAPGYVVDQPVNVTKVGGTTQTAGDIMADTNDIQTRLPAALVGGRMDSSVGAVAANAITAASIAADAIGASELAADAVNEIADQVWDEILSGHAIAGSTGAALAAAGGSGDPWATALPGAYGAGTAGKIIGDNLNATVSSRATQTSVDTLATYVDTEVAAIKAKTDNLPVDPADASDIAASFATVNTKLDTIDDFVDTEVAAIKAKTDNLPASPAAVGSAMTLTSAERDATATALLKLDWTGITGEAARSLLNAARFLRNRWRIAGGTLTVYKENDSTSAWTGPVTQTAGNPVSEIDPT